MDAYTGPGVRHHHVAQGRDAFDLSREPDKVRDRYGNKDDKYIYVGKAPDSSWDGQKFLLARRLVEAGVPVVTLRTGLWDHHGNVIQRAAASASGTVLKTVLPLLDRSIHALVTDLHERGLDKEVLVLVWGEFGRTPKISQAGRDHWPDAGFALFAGGGLKTGQVIGETDSHGGPAEDPARSTPRTSWRRSITSWASTRKRPCPTFNGRPQYLLDDREPISELIGWPFSVHLLSNPALATMSEISLAKEPSFFMAAPTLPPPTQWTVADLLARFGPILISRIRTDPAPGTATEADVIEIHDREGRLYELVDGVLVEKAMGYHESYLACLLIHS